MDRLERQERLSERIINYKHDINQDSTPFTKGMIIAHQESLKELWSKFQRQHFKLMTKTGIQSTDYFVRDVFAVTQRSYNATIGYLYDEQWEQAAPAQQVRSLSTAPTRVHLPKIQPPRFSGKEEDWEAFRGLFISLIDEEPSFSAVEKLHFLKTAVEGQAKEAIKKVKITEGNYTIAWNILLQRYENVRLLVLRHLNTLSSLETVRRREWKDLQSLLDTVSSIRESLRNLGRPVEQWDDIFVFYVSRALDSVTSQEWEQSIATNQKMPSYDDQAAFVQGSIRALKAGELSKGKAVVTSGSRASESSKPPNRVRSLGMTVNNKPGSSLTCPVCRERHYTMRCPTFLKASVEKRREIVANRRLCFNCLSHGHPVSHCSSDATCKECRGKHHTLIHRSMKRVAHENPRQNPEKRQCIETQAADSRVADFNREPTQN